MQGHVDTYSLRVDWDVHDVICSFSTAWAFSPRSYKGSATLPSDRNDNQSALVSHKAGLASTNQHSTGGIACDTQDNDGSLEVLG